jgi:hypothetical protein
MRPLLPSRSQPIAPAAPPACPLQRRRELVCCAAQSESDNGDTPFEAARRAKAQAKIQAKVKVNAPIVEAAKEGQTTESGRTETAVLLALALVFGAIILEGLLVASSGFLADEADGWIQARGRRRRFVKSLSVDISSRRTSCPRSRLRLASSLPAPAPTVRSLSLTAWLLSLFSDF